MFDPPRRPQTAAKEGVFRKGIFQIIPPAITRAGQFRSGFFIKSRTKPPRNEQVFIK